MDAAITAGRAAGAPCGFYCDGRLFSLVTPKSPTLRALRRNKDSGKNNRNDIGRMSSPIAGAACIRLPRLQILPNVETLSRKSAAQTCARHAGLDGRSPLRHLFEMGVFFRNTRYQKIHRKYKNIALHTELLRTLRSPGARRRPSLASRSTPSSSPLLSLSVERRLASKNRAAAAL